MVMATIELAGRLDPSEITVNALHPGTLLDTKMVHEGFGAPQAPVDIGVEAELYLATSADVESVSGQYFDRIRPARANAQAYDCRGASTAMAGKPEAHRDRDLRLSQTAELRRSTVAAAGALLKTGSPRPFWAP